MPSKDTIAGCEHVAKATVDLLEFRHTPNLVSDAILETLIEMSAETRINIWHKETGIGVESLTALYSMYERGAGFRRMRLYGEYEAGRLYRRRVKNKAGSNSKLGPFPQNKLGALRGLMVGQLDF